MIFTSFNRSLKNVLVGLIVCSVYTHAEQTSVQAQTTVDQTAQVTENQALDALLNTALQQTNHIDTIIQDIALVTSNNQSLTKEQRAAIAKEIREIHSQLALFKNQSFTQADLQSIYLLLVINKELCKHLTKELKKGFTRLEAFPFAEHVAQAVQRKIVSPELINQELVDNEIALSLLSHSAENIGLSWYNKAYRVLDKALIEPWQKYHLTHYATVAVGTTVVAAGAWWFLTKRGDIEIDPETLKPIVTINPVTQKEVLKRSGSIFEQKLRKLMGPHPIIGEKYINLKTNTILSTEDGLRDALAAKITTVANEQDLKIPGHIEKNWKEISIVGALVSSQIWPRIKNDCIAIKNGITKKVVSAHNNLRGGVYKNRTIKTSSEDYFKIATASFDDIIGAENAKTILSGVIDYLINPEKSELAKTVPEKGYLLTGPARTGKTFMVEAFAGEVRKRLQEQGKNPDTVKFLPADVATISALGGIKEYLAFAKKNAPCIIFIDEIDLLGLQRAGGNSTMLADFLVALSDFSQQDADKQVIILAATNRSENLDEALKRRGRLGIEIRFTYPAFEYRKDFFEHKLQAIGIATDTLDLDSLARQTVGRSYNDLDSVLKKAILQAKAQAQPLDQNLLERAVDSELLLILPEKDHPLSQKERLLIASAISGQAMIEYLFDSGAPVLRATICPYLPKLQEKSPWDAFFKEDGSKQELIKYGKIFTASTFEFLDESYTTEQLRNKCKSLLAGHCAQKVLLDAALRDKDTTLNMQKAFALTKQLVGKGIDEKMLSDAKRDELSDKAYALLDTLEEEVIKALTDHKEELKRLTSILLKLGTLNGEEIAYVIDGVKTQPVVPEKNNDNTSIIENPAIEDPAVAA